MNLSSAISLNDLEHTLKINYTKIQNTEEEETISAIVSQII